MDVESFSLPLADPLSTAGGTIDSREGFVVTLDAPPGVGEATPLPGWTESLSACADALDAAASIADTRGPEAALASLDPARTPTARHGLDLAIADRRAREAGTSLAAFLGSAPSDAVPVNATVGDAPPEATAERASAAIADGFGTIKLKVGARPVGADVARVRAVREAVGSGPVLRVDANGAWTRTEAGRAIDELARLVTYVEQPLPAAELDGHAALRGRGVEIALDEAICEHSLEAIATADAADVLVIKPMALGGLRRAREVTLRARDRGIDPVITTTIDAVLARTAAVHLAASLGLDRACGLATADRLRADLAPDPAPVSDGTIPVPDGPGIGVRLE